jgi:1-aminocyclopropane-1-carboxylate deaminase
MNDLYRRTAIPTDFVYTAKLFYAVIQLAAEKTFEKGSRILVLHSGGLQGNYSLAPGILEF